MDRYKEDLRQILPAHSMPKIKDKNNNNNNKKEYSEKQKEN